MKKNQNCCLCGKKFKNFYETNNPFPYPTNFYLNNNSERCCGKCNAIVIGLRLNSEVTKELLKIAHENSLNEEEKKAFISFLYSELGSKYSFQNIQLK